MAEASAAGSPPFGISFTRVTGRTKVKFADTRLTTSDLSGLGFEASLGFNAAVAENAYCYGAVTLEAGEAYTSYQLNAGLRVSF